MSIANCSNKKGKVKGAKATTAAKSSEKSLPELKDELKDEVIVLRVTKTDKELFRTISRMKGCTITKFILDTMYNSVRSI